MCYQIAGWSSRQGLPVRNVPSVFDLSFFRSAFSLTSSGLGSSFIFSVSSCFVVLCLVFVSVDAFFSSVAGATVLRAGSKLPYSDPSTDLRSCEPLCLVSVSGATF